MAHPTSTVTADVPMEMLREVEGITAKLYFGVERLIVAPDAPGYPAPPLALADLADMAGALNRILSGHDSRLHRHGGAA